MQVVGGYLMVEREDYLYDVVGNDGEFGGIGKDVLELLFLKL